MAFAGVEGGQGVMVPQIVIGQSGKCGIFITLLINFWDSCMYAVFSFCNDDSTRGLEAFIKPYV